MTMTRTTSALSLGLLSLGLLASACQNIPDEAPPVTLAPVTVEQQDAKAEWPDEPFRAERPTPRAIAPVEIPTFETFTLSNGLEVYLIQQQTLPTVMMLFEFNQGSVTDPARKAGLSGVCADLLDESTKTKDKASFAAAQDDHAVSVWASGGSESSTVGVRALQHKLPEALDLAAEMMLEPGMRSEDFEVLKDQRKNGVEQSKGSPSSIAYRVFPSLIWGAKHPYGQLETDESIDAISLSDCKKWVAKLEPKGNKVWVVGKVGADELKKQLEDRLGKWTGSAPVRRKVGAAKHAEGTMFFIHVPDAAQSQIIVGHPGPARDAADYEATQMVAAILGGSFSSRINMNLREDKGWAYGARGSFAYTPAGSYFNAGSSVRTDATGGALREIAKEIQTMRTTDPTAEELSREQAGALLGMPARFATATRSLYQFRSLAYYGLPLDWHVGHQERLRKLDIPAVRAAAETHLQASGHVVLVVGDAKVVLEDLEKIAAEGIYGKGGLKFLDADGQPAKRPKI
ncbi:peptidase M16-like protein [Plesiocystis pacifica SIR-1]|uniref:Peptidase M16-like protein n=2 Tax=Plesiocystis pacifica TaxID=191768 RepID=A6GF33_9BACT|nr:peptidase M16-like protein [Plesiocystis pacifica SIR-1]